MSTASSGHTAFHFSPRPNRAHEIRWREWSNAAFTEAAQSDKPILLAISAVWCHWCHVMDETTYSQRAIIDAINDHYVPVRVDNDRRPDINARYNQGGWPTTAFLTPDGSLLAGATYLPPEQMGAALQQIADFYKKNRAEIEQRSLQIRAHGSNEVGQTGELSSAIVDHVLQAIEQQYDEEYGGFGVAPKFPMVDVLEFLLQEFRTREDQRVYDMLARTLLGMAGNGMYDHVEGGFFRYSTTRDWSIPHFEKMTEDHAGLIRVLAGLSRTTRNEQFRGTLISAIRYVRTVLRDPNTGLFAGSQDADEEYYALPLEERRKRNSPYVDRTSYCNWSAAMAGAFLCAADALDDEHLAAEGEATLDTMHDEDGLLFHFIEAGSGKAPQVRGLLSDQSAYFRALMDAHEYGGQPRFLRRAQTLAGAIEQHFAAPDGGFYDHARFEEPLGNLDVRDRPLAENSLLAESFLRLAVLSDEPGYRETATRALMLYATTYERAGMFAAPYARSLRRYLSVAASVMLVGSDRETADLREAAHNLPEPLICVGTIDPNDAAALAKRGFDPALHPVAYLCREKACAAPALTAADLRGAFETLAR
jgi:uncharacterized protein YyaL (SSP411 family)